MDNIGANEFDIAFSRVLNATHGLKHEHSTAFQDFKKEK